VTATAPTSGAFDTRTATRTTWTTIATRPWLPPVTASDSSPPRATEALPHALHCGRRADRSLAIGNAIVAWLLAGDNHGNRYARPRRMGVQEIAWNGRVWTSSRREEGLRTIHHGDRRRRWVHIALTWAGARMQTSYWR
jgi:hypothetical protein